MYLQIHAHEHAHDCASTCTHAHESGFLDIFLHGLQHTLIDTLKLLPFLFLTYLFMEWLEHRHGEKMKTMLATSGKVGPLLGGLLGAVPQCGFSAVSASFYTGKIITLGTLFAVFLSTSDEMIPVLLTGGANPWLIVKIVGIKILVALFFGFLIDFVLRFFRKKELASPDIQQFCKAEGCHCEKGIFRSALSHTLHIGLFIFVFSFVIHLIVSLIGQETLNTIFAQTPVLGVAISCLVGLVPSCAGSGTITNLYLSGLISAGAMLGGLLTGAGVGILVLFRTNRKQWKSNLLILLALFLIGFLCGILGDILPLEAFLA